MKYFVNWVPHATGKLASIWIAAPGRNAVTKSSEAIDRLLRNDPEDKGIPWGGHLLLHVPPLLVVYNVIPDDLRVDVIEVWHD